MKKNSARKWLEKRNSRDLEAIKRIPILSVAADLRIKLRSGSCRCPLPGHDDHSPSFHVNARTNTWRCYACGVGGSVIDLVMQMSGWDFDRTIAWIRIRYFARGTAARPRLNRTTGIDQNSNTSAAAYCPDPEVYEWVLGKCPLGQDAINYFGGRAISEATLRDFQTAQVGELACLVESAVHKFGYIRLQAAGLLMAHSSPRRPVFVFPSGSVVFPFFRDGRCQYLQARRIGNSIARYRWVNLSGIHKPIFNAKVLDDPLAVNVVLCEGVSDTLSAVEMGRNAVGLLGAGSSLSEGDSALLRGKDVYIVADRDEAGRKMSVRLHNQLARLGVRPTIQQLPRGCNDLNEYLVQYRMGNGR